MLDVTTLPIGEEPEPGESYLVPCVDLRDIDIPSDAGFEPFKTYQATLDPLPIIGHIHRDPEFRGAGGEDPHIHIDMRFLTDWEFERLWKKPEYHFNNSYHPTFPILPDVLHLPKPHLHPKQCRRRLADFRRMQIGYDGDYAKFEDEMEKHTIKLDHPVCPHHGTPLAGQPVRDGVITCPTHGATWCAKTGCLVRKTTSRSTLQTYVRVVRAVTG